MCDDEDPRVWVGAPVSDDGDEAPSVSEEFVMFAALLLPLASSPCPAEDCVPTATAFFDAAVAPVVTTDLGGLDELKYLPPPGLEEKNEE